LSNKYGFVYIWFDSRKHKFQRTDIKHKFYIGCHWGTEDDGYICSSSWMKKSYKKRPQDFKRRILKTNILDKKTLLYEEYIWLSKIKKEELGKRYYNVHNHHFNHWTTYPELIDDVKNKIKEKRKSQTFSEETRKKMSESHKGRELSTEFKNYIGQWKKGYVPSPKQKETLDRYHESLRGKPAHNRGVAVPEAEANRLRTLTKGCIYINNGISSTLIKKELDIPEGWVKGRLKLK